MGRARKARGRAERHHSREARGRRGRLAVRPRELAQGARVHRASLQCQRRPIEAGDPRALADIEIYPLSAPYQKGSPPKTEAQPLALVPPWYQSFDMTNLVRGWMAEKPNHGLYVKKFPGWRIDKTYLDLMYEGQPGDVPRQASGLKALHRDGQTFLTWKEIEDPVGNDEVIWCELKAITALPRTPGAFRPCSGIPNGH